MTQRSTAADSPTGHPPRDLTDLDQAGRVWAVMRELAESYPPKPQVRAVLNLGRGSGRFRALEWLAEGPLSLSQLADAVQVDAPYATLIVDTLEQRGLVERRPDPGDRRATLVEVTEQGASVLDAIRAARGTEAERAFGKLSPADRDDLARILRQLRD